MEAALAALTKVAETGDGNLLEIAVEAARAPPSVGEISDAMRAVFGDHTTAVLRCERYLRSGLCG